MHGLVRVGFNRFLGGTASLFFRLISYTLLQWIPGRQGLVLPWLFLVYLITWIRNNAHLNAKRKEAQLVLTDGYNSADQHEDHIQPPPIVEQPLAPSFAKVTATGNASPSPSSVASTRSRRGRNRRAASYNNYDDNGQLVRRKSRKGKGKVSRKWTFLTGAPGDSKVLNWFALLANLGLLAATMDFIFTPIIGLDQNDLAFIRVGAVGHSTAKLLARVPPPDWPASAAATNATADTSLPPPTPHDPRVVYRPTKPLGKWLPGPPLLVTSEHDWTAVVQLTRLWPNTQYEYRVLTDGDAYHPAFPRSQKFTTAPDPALASSGSAGGGTHFTFASTSCVKANFPYRGPWQHSVVEGAKHLSKAIEDYGLNFLVFIGDYIYADTPFYGGADVESYHKRYRQIQASKEMRDIYENLPTWSIWDDHEIVNDYDTAGTDEAFAPAQAAYLDYLGNVNPAPYREGVNYYATQYGDAAFFVWDTRAYRSSNHAEDDENKTMLGQQQKDDFFKWVAKVNQTVTWKFVVSSVPMHSLYSHGEDTWAGFLTERDEIMDVLETVDNVIILTGDRHEFSAASIRTKVTEFSTSPLNQFYLPIRTVSQRHNRGSSDEDHLLKYIPDGNSKFSTFEVDTRVPGKPVVNVKVIVDGEVAWEVQVQGRPLVPPPPPKGVGALGKSLFELLGFKKRNWFF